MKGLWAAVFAASTLGAFARPAAAAGAANDFLVVCGKKEVRRAGPIDARTTYADLVRLFGKDKLKNATIVMGEDGAESPTTEILDKDAAATLIWETDERVDLVSVIMTDKTSRWRTKDGVRPGASVRQLEKINGGPFRFSGLGWDYGGLIQDDKGRLAALGGLELALDGDGPSDALSPFLGDKVEPMSNAPGIDKAGVHVAAMTLRF